MDDINKRRPKRSIHTFKRQGMFSSQFARRRPVPEHTARRETARIEHSKTIRQEQAESGSVEGTTDGADPTLRRDDTTKLRQHKPGIHLTFAERPSFSALWRWMRPQRQHLVRTAMVWSILLIVFSQLITILQPYITNHTYALGNAEGVLTPKDPLFATKLVHNVKNAEFDFNANYSPSMDSNSVGGGGPKIIATAYENPSKGLDVKDPINNIDFTVKPQVKMWAGRKESNRVVYPLKDGTGWFVYTMGASGVKEDVLLRNCNGDKMVLKYDLGLGDNYAARLESDGSIGIYGSDLPITGQVSTGSAKDAALLSSARKHAAKNKLFYSFPAPTIHESGYTNSKVRAKYELSGEKLTTIVTGLKQGRYPLSIDPAVTVTSTGDLFRDSTPESNVDFSATTGNISRGAVTGGVINTWTTNGNNLATARFDQSVAVYDDWVYVAGGIPQGAGTSPLNTIEIAHINSANPSIGTWSTTTNLPVALARFQLLAYNGYLYAIGGTSADNLCNTPLSSVYYIRIQSSGQLSGSWTTNANSIPTAVCGVGATAYNGMIYIAGGQTGKQFNTGITTTAYASINPDGSVSAFTSSAVVLPVGLTGADVRAYNGYLYVTGGNTTGGGAPTVNTVYYDSIASDGSIYGSGSSNWNTTSAFATARANAGSSFTFAYDGFMYLIGGCNNFNASFNCSAPLSDVQVAQINADGTLGAWSTDSAAALGSTVVGGSIVSWRGNIYNIAGCTTTANNVTCTTAVATQQYSAIQNPGQVGSLQTTTVLPASVYGHGSVVNNGFIYVVGGCATNSCQTGTNDTSGTIYYAALNGDGTVGSWTTDSTNKINTTTGLAFMALTVYDNYLYAAGGYSNNGSGATGSVATATIFYVKLNSNGSLSGAWNTSTGANGLTNASYDGSVIANHGFLIYIGGCSNSGGGVACGTYYTTVETFTINTSTGALSSRTGQTGLSSGKANMAAAFYNGYVYLAGGQTSGSAQTNNILYASVSSSGAITSWSTATGTLVHNLTRADASIMNGILYVTGGYDGTTIYGTIELGKITLSSGNIGSNLADSQTTITARWNERTVFTNGYMYMTGGCTAGAVPASCSARSTLDEYVENNYAGNKNTGTWTNAANSYATNVVGGATTVTNGFIYITGGCATSYTVATSFSPTNSNCVSGDEIGSTSYAAINADGSLGSWTTSGNTFPSSAKRAFGCLVTAGGYLYYIGGEDGSNNARSTVYYGAINTNGTPGTWTASTTPLGGGGGITRMNIACDTFNNYIYVTGGYDGTNVDNTTHYSSSRASGGDITTWNTAGSNFTTARENQAAVTAGGYLYIMGGDDKTNALIDVQYIQLNPSTGATVGSWAYTTDLPQPVSGQGSFGANGYIYLVGGRTAFNTCISTSVVAPINSTGTLGAWSGSANNLASARFGNAVAFNNGYYYSLGGDDCTSIITSNVLQQGGERSQSMRSWFSKYADLNGNGQPEKLVIYLTNAQNNGVDIEQWSMTYRSSRTAANSWGALTTVTPLLNENAYTVQALDGSSVNQVVAEWYWLTFTINMEQSFTFTDDTQPTIFQYGLHYAPPPSKRLMHGRDFRDQNQQGDDLKLGI